MKRCSFFCAGWWPFILLPLLLLLPLLYFCWDNIEKSVAGNTENQLKEQGIQWAKTETFNRGRDVLLTGTAPNQDAVDQAVSVAQNSEGVRVAEFSGDIAKAVTTPATFSATNTDGSIILSGVLADQASIDSLVSQANKVYGADRVINRLIRNNTVMQLPISNQDTLFTTIAQLGDGGELALSDKQLKLSGEVADGVTKTSIGSTLSGLFGFDLDNQLTIKPVLDNQAVCVRPINQLLSEEKIYFSSGKASIQNDSFAVLSKIAEVINGCQSAQFEIAGHTDSTGNLAFNLTLSKKRAQAVVDHLVGLGLSADKFSASGYGPNNPVADNGTKQGRAKNRRIEFKLKN